jgi:hypothetical protein
MHRLPRSRHPRGGFGFNRSRGILIKASRGTITNCTLRGSWIVGILVSPEWWWLESGSSSHTAR